MNNRRPSTHNLEETRGKKPSNAMNGVNAYFGIDFRHAVEFSRIGRTPRFRLSFEAPGQPAKHYCSVRGPSNRPLSSQSLCVSQ